jgi:hypothetical protein
MDERGRVVGEHVADLLEELRRIVPEVRRTEAGEEVEVLAVLAVPELNSTCTTASPA